MGDEAAFQRILAGSRDHARTPMQWEKAKYAGFSTVEPWIGMDDDYMICNVEDQMKREDSGPELLPETDPAKEVPSGPGLWGRRRLSTERTATFLPITAGMSRPSSMWSVT